MLRSLTVSLASLVVPYFLYSLRKVQISYLLHFWWRRRDVVTLLPTVVDGPVYSMYRPREGRNTLFPAYVLQRATYLGRQLFCRNQFVLQRRHSVVSLLFSCKMSLVLSTLPETGIYQSVVKCPNVTCHRNSSRGSYVPCRRTNRLCRLVIPVSFAKSIRILRIGFIFWGLISYLWHYYKHRPTFAVVEAAVLYVRVLWCARNME
jgi:hypothetical protein